MIYTGYFARTKQYTDNGLQVVSIAGKAPDFFKGPKYPSLAPKYEMFMDWKKGKIDNFDYTRIFKERLNSLDPHAVKRFLTSFDKDVVLLCYEKPGDFCHRHIVADWIEENLGLIVEEYDFNKVKAEKEIVEYIKFNPCTEEELTDMFGINPIPLLRRLEGEAPEGYFLYKKISDNNIEYTLEDSQEFLREFGVN